MLDHVVDGYKVLARRLNESDPGRLDHEALGELEAHCLSAATLATLEVSKAVVKEWFIRLRASARATDFGPTAAYGTLQAAAADIKALAQDSFHNAIHDFYSGNEEAFTTLYRQAVPRLIGYLRGTISVLTMEDVEEIVAGFFSDFYEDVNRARPKYNPAQGPFLPWAQTVVYHKGIDYLRKQKRLAELPDDMAIAGPSSTEGVEMLMFTMWITATLSPLQRQVFALKFESELPQQEICEIIRRSPSEVSKIIDEIRAGVIRQLHLGGYEEQLNDVLERVADRKGLMPRLFLRWVVPTLLKLLAETPDWDDLMVSQFGPLWEEELQDIRAESSQATEEVATKVMILFHHVANVEPQHQFCSAVRRVALTPWGSPLTALLHTS